MGHQAADLAHRLARNAEAVCRRYLSNGRREGRYWLVGDVRNTPGRSLFVRLQGPESGKGAAGKWTDAATGEHGDLLDIIRESCGLADFSDVADETRRFFSLPKPDPAPDHARPSSSVLAGSPESARRLFEMSQPISGTIVETYLRRRGITALHGTANLRFHPRCYYRPDPDSPTETWPAMIAAVTDLGGTITGAHRTWLDPSGQDKAPIDTPRRAMGDLLGNAVRFGVAHDVMAAGEGIETMLSLRCVVPTMPMVAALSAAHLAAIRFPGTLRRLYIARDNDPAGDGAVANLIDRSREAGIEAITLSPRLGDSTRISARSASMLCGQPSGCRSSRRTSVASWRWRHPAPGRRGCAAAPASSRIRSRGSRPPIVGEDRAQGLLRGRSGGKRPGQAMAEGRLFSAGGPRGRRLCIAKQNSRHPPSSAPLRPSAALRVQVRPARRLSSP